MKKAWIGIIVIAVVALSISLIIMQPKGESDTIKIGAILPLTGSSAQWGIQPKQGAELASEQINNAGGINRKKIQIFFQDDQGDPQKAVSAFLSLRTILFTLEFFRFQAA